MSKNIRIKKGKKPDSRSKVGARSGIPALKRRTSRAVRHASKQVVTKVALEENDRAEAKLADSTYLGLHPETVDIDVSPPKKKKFTTNAARKKRAYQAAVTFKKREAEAQQKELERIARSKAARRAKRRAAARALQRARES
jgi:hypothetical protein